MKTSRLKLAVYGVLGLFILFHLFLISKTLLFDNSGNLRVAISGYGDIPFHLTQVTKFGYGSLFDLNEPIFTGTSIKYVFFINWISGFLFKITHNLVFSFHLPSMLFAVAGTILTFSVYKKLLKKEWLALIAVLVFFLGSGFGGHTYVTEHLFGGSISEFTNFLVNNNISTVTKWDAVYPQQNIGWGAPLSLVFLHQRAFFLGLALFSLFFYLLLRFQETRERKFLYSLVLILGLSPLAHYHSFVAMGFITVLFGIFNFWKKDHDLFWKTVYILVLAAIISIPEVIYLISGKSNIVTGSNSFIDFRIGWMAQPTIGSVKYPNIDPSLFEVIIAYTKFLWINFGIILPLFIGTAIWNLKSKMQSSNFRLFILGGVSFFMLNQLFKFQPWDYDNNKILVYFQFFATPVLIWFLSRYRKAISLPLLAVFFILATYSGIVDVIPRYLVPINRMPVIFDKGAIEMASFIRNNVDEKDLIVTSSTHLNVVSSLAGRPVLVGYPGWLWTKGIDYGPREYDLKNFYQDPNNIDILTKYNAKYILLDFQTLNDWKAKINEFDQRFEKVFERNSLILYKTGL